MTATSESLLAERAHADAAELPEPGVRATAPAGGSHSGRRDRRSATQPARTSLNAGDSRARGTLEPRPGQRLAFRTVIRSANGYAVDAPAGRVGWVDEVRVGPWDFWPESLIVAAEDERRLLLPVHAIARALPAERRLILSDTPAGVRAVPHPSRPWHDRAEVWRLQAQVGALAGIAGSVATFAALALDATLELSPVLAGLGAIGAAASASVWRSGRRNWLAAVGLGSAWLPLTVGAILSLVWILRGMAS